MKKNKTNPISPSERAYQVLEICSYELRDVPQGIKDFLVLAIRGQIEDAVEESIRQKDSELK